MSDLTLKQLQNMILQQAADKGFGTTPDEINVAEKIALIHSEVSEAYEAYRHKNMTGGKDSFEDELGDVIQRTLHLAAVMNVDIEQAILNKLKINESREWKSDELNETLVK